MGQANIPLLGVSTILTTISALFPALSTNVVSLILGLIIAAIVILLLYWIFGTEIGCAIRATGNNEYMVRALGVNTDKMKIIGLVLSNGLVALSGAMVAQSQGYADVGMGTGTIMIGLASVIIGEVLMGNRFSFAYKLISMVVGSVLYRVIIALVLWLGLKSTDLKLLTAVMVAIALAIPVLNRVLQPVKKKLDKILLPVTRKLDQLLQPVRRMLNRILQPLNRLLDRIFQPLIKKLHRKHKSDESEE